MIGGNLGGGGRGGRLGAQRAGVGVTGSAATSGGGTGLEFGLGFGLWRSRRGPLADLTKKGPGADRLTVLGDDFGEDPRCGRVDFEGHLVGFKFDDGFVRHHRLARLFEPAPDGCFGDRFAQSGHADFSCHLSRPKPSGLLLDQFTSTCAAHVICSFA